jgi:hypothetical protein
MHTPQATRHPHRAIDHQPSWANGLSVLGLAAACIEADEAERIDHRRSERSFSGLERKHCGYVPLLVTVVGVRGWLRT